MRSTRRILPLLAVLVALAALARAQSEAPAGRVASLEGRADAQRAGQQTWTALAPGKDVFVGDRVRTGDASRLKLLMRDDAVLTLGPRSELTIDAQVVRGGPEAPDTSRLGQLVGALRAVVTERYGTRGASFEVKTPTAIAGVRGTGFVSLVDEDGKRTRVVGLYDVTSVRGVADPPGRHEVAVGPHQITEVLAGQAPTKPRELSAREFGDLVGSTEAKGGPPPGGAGAPGAEGSGDVGDPATPGQPGGPALNRPGSQVDQPIDQFRGPREPPPPPPRR